MQEQGYSLQDVAGLMRRRSRMIGVSFASIIIASLVIAYSLDNLYRSSGTIMIERPEVSEMFLRETYQAEDREQRIARINDEVMTRQNLAGIIDEHDLYLNIRPQSEPELGIPELRENFELELFYAEDDPRVKIPGEVNGFRLSYYHPDPVTARDVARDIVDLFQEGNRQRRQQAYLETAAALKREADNLEQQVALAEKELADFKSRYPGALPEDRNQLLAIPGIGPTTVKRYGSALLRIVAAAGGSEAESPARQQTATTPGENVQVTESRADKAAARRSPDRPGGVSVS